MHFETFDSSRDVEITVVERGIVRPEAPHALGCPLLRVAFVGTEVDEGLGVQVEMGALWLLDRHLEQRSIPARTARMEGSGPTTHNVQ